jgi:ATP-binding protein involved in chromosome partitioning
MWDATTSHSAYTWRGMMEMAALREMLTDTVWGELDYLLIDVPPGTDKLPNMLDLLPDISGTVMVSIPSEVSQFVVGKTLHLAKQVLDARVVGLVENMSAYVCSACGKEEMLFPGEGLEALAEHYQVPFLGKIPFDPRMVVSADAGVPYIVQYDDAPAAGALRQIATRVHEFFR